MIMGVSNSCLAQLRRDTRPTLVEPGCPGCSCDIVWHRNMYPGCSGDVIYDYLGLFGELIRIN